MSSVTREHVKFMERAVVQQVLDAFAGEHLSFFVLAGNCAFGSCAERRLAALFEVIQPFRHAGIGHDN